MANIDKQDAQFILSYFNAPGGLGAGSFTKSLIHTYSLADYTNRRRLALAFPSLAAAFDLAQSTEDGIKRLQEIAA